MSEYNRFLQEFKKVCFMDHPYKRNKLNYIFLLECYAVHPFNYYIDNLRQYRKVYTWNSKLHKDLLLEGVNSVLVNGFPLFDNYSTLESFIPIDEKIHGISLVCRDRPKTNLACDISYKRTEVMNKIQGMVKHCYGKIPYGGDMYQGIIGRTGTNETYPSSIQKLMVLNKYKFHLCFENCYDSYHSMDYVTEKIFDAFKAKTVPIYWGAYNIQDIIPKHLYIDFRDFFDAIYLSVYLNQIPNEQIVSMTEEAYEFVKKSRYGNVDDLKKLLKKEGE